MRTTFFIPIAAGFMLAAPWTLADGTPATIRPETETMTQRTERPLVSKGAYELGRETPGEILPSGNFDPTDGEPRTDVNRWPPREVPAEVTPSTNYGPYPILPSTGVMDGPSTEVPFEFAQYHFGLDDYPPDPVTFAPNGFGYGAENPFAVSAPGFPGGYAPSPTLGYLGCIDSDILQRGPYPHSLAQSLWYLDSLSMNTESYARPIRIGFSVDRLAEGAPASAVEQQAGLHQHAADMYRGQAQFRSPTEFRNTVGPAGYGGPLWSRIGGVPSNELFYDESFFGLRAGYPGPVPATVATPAIGHGTHDNIDQFEREAIDLDHDGRFDGWGYFTLYPTEAAMYPGRTPADIFVVPPGTRPQVSFPFADARSMGLDHEDSIDALVVFDNERRGTMANRGATVIGRFPDTFVDHTARMEAIEAEGGAQPQIDYALFSLAPGSRTLEELALGSGDIFYTNFTGTFWLYAGVEELGLTCGPHGRPGCGDNIDALEISCVVDLDWDGEVGADDLMLVLTSWGENSGHSCDVDLSGTVDFADVMIIFSAWGPSS